MDALETIETDTLIGELYYHEGCDNPRLDDDKDARFLFLGLPHRNYDIGDETIDPSTFRVECPECEGTGENENIGDTLCLRCEGEGELMARNMEELLELIQLHYNPRILRKVGMYEHGGRAFYLGGGPHAFDSAGWDSGTCGFIMVTREALVARGGEKWADEKTDEELIGWLEGEVQTYEDWAEGRTYGYRIFEKCQHDDCCRGCDGKGDEVDSCWGFIGDDGMVALQEAMDCETNYRLTKRDECGKVMA